jgi:Secretion system C-terminal sorting domain/FG-GAP-like repeat
MKKIFTILSVFTALFANAQFQYQIDQSVPVVRNGASLTAPWVGGLNAAQYNTMDMNEDGNEDLVLFDRMGQKVLTYLNVSNTYHYAPEYESFFPPDVSNWLLLRDFNQDGKKDIFTGDILGIRVFKNVSSGTSIEWKLFPFYTQNVKSEVLLTKGLSGMINLQMQYDDLPSISDVDGDGDLDIFSVDYGGSGTLNFHRNYSKERFNIYDSLTFELVDKAWGDFKECECAVFSYNNESCPTGGDGGRTKHAGGKSILMLDVNNDGNQDVLLSEAECVYLSLLQNQGTIDAPVIQESSLFPSTPANFIQFPTGYFEDVDFDGVKDLVVSPNIYTKANPQTDLQRSNWFYKNTGTNSLPNFVLQGKAFLQENMLDFGDNTVPALGDLEGDGDLDLFISNNNFPATIALLRNTGSKNEPEFVLESEDYLGMSIFQFRNLKIQFSDLNKDGNVDLVLTAIPSGLNTNGMFAIYNEKKGGLNFNISTLEQVPFTISGSENILMTDVNSDGSPDILKGKNNGAVEYWRNNGNLSFSLEDNEFLGLTPDPLFTNLTLAAGDLDANGKPDLVISNSSGRLQIYSDYKNFPDGGLPETDIVYNPLTENYFSPNLGGRVWPVVGNIFNKGKPVIITGTSLGGVRVLRPQDETGPANAVNIFPNPVRPDSGESLTIILDSDAKMEVYSITGARIYKEVELKSNEAKNFEVSQLSKGIYIVKIITTNKTLVQRIVVH